MSVTDRPRHPKSLNATQRQALESLYDFGRPKMLSNRNRQGTIAASTARVLRDRGLVRLTWQHFSESASITEAGRRRVQEWDAIRRGR